MENNLSMIGCFFICWSGFGKVEILITGADEAKDAGGVKIVDMGGDESIGLSGMFREVEAELSSVKVEGDDIINNNRIEIIDPDNKQFKIVQWDDYPDDIVPMPDQNKAWVLLEDDNYQNARKQIGHLGKEIRTISLRIILRYMKLNL